MTVKYSGEGIRDNTDETKVMSFDVSGVTTNTTRTLTMPDGDVKLPKTDGTSGQVLTSTGTGSVPTWQDKMPSKSVLQVIQGSVTYNTTINGGNTYTTVGLSVNITPSASSSKILIHIQGGGHRIDAHDMAWKGNVFRGSTDLASTLYSKECLSNHYVYGGTSGSAYDYEFPESIQVLDEPATTSPITYTYKVKANNRVKWNIASAPTTITLMEIAG